MGMVVMVILAVVVVIYFFSAIIRYYSDGTLRKSIITCAWILNSLAALFCAGLFRSLYVMDERQTDSLFRAGGNLDRVYIWLVFGLAIIVILLLFSFYQKKFTERFWLVSSLQLVVVSLGYLLMFYLEPSKTGIYFYRRPLFSLFLGIILFLLNRKYSEDSLKELFFAFFGRLFST